MCVFLFSVLCARQLCPVCIMPDPSAGIYAVSFERNGAIKVGKKLYTPDDALGTVEELLEFLSEQVGYLRVRFFSLHHSLRLIIAASLR